MALGKGAGIAKSTILVLLWCSAQFGGLEAGNPRNTRGLGNSGKERVLQIDVFGAFVVFHPFRRPWKPEIQEIQPALKWAPEKERVLQNRRFSCFRGVPLHFGGLGSRKFKKYKGPWKWPPEKERVSQNRQFLCFLWCSPHVGGRSARDARDVGLLGTRRA